MDKKTRRALYDRWKSMKRRCDNPKDKSYKYYGGRGISYAREWESFKAFEKWSLENGFDMKLQLDRRDNDQGYSPENCQWVTRTENMRNRSGNTQVEIGGQVKTLQEWSEISGISRSTLKTRLDAGRKESEFLDKPKKQFRKEKRKILAK